MAKISRRDFLKGSAAAALMTAAAGLAGCTPASDSKKESAPAAAPETAAPVEKELLYTAYVNPQNYDYRSNTKELKTLFSPITIGNVTSSHRMVKTAAGSATYLSTIPMKCSITM